MPQAARRRIRVPFRGLKSAKTLLSELQNLGVKTAAAAQLTAAVSALGYVRYLKGLPRLRALARTTIIERFNTIAARAADVPASTSAVKCATCATDHVLLPIRTIWPNTACRHSFRI
jgi:hypothetical protein